MPNPPKAKAQHTPGPWTVEGRSKSFPEGLIIHGGETWCELAAVADNGETNESTEANARLIAAAPALLGALEEIAEFQCTCEVFNHTEDSQPCESCIARAAIALAKGEAQ